MDNTPGDKLGVWRDMRLADALVWFEDYLSNRQQYVCINGVNADITKIECGVLQDSILGPLLFLLC